MPQWEPAEERFWARVNRNGPMPEGPVEGCCWVWQGAPNHRGYGRILVDGASQRVHRYSYELHHGPIPDTYDIDHLCWTRLCVNPAHLEAVPPGENIRRAIERSLMPAWERHRQQTHCKHGHEFDEANTWVDKRGSRHCRTCARLRARERAARERAALS